MPQVLEQLQFSVCALRQDGGAEGLHNLLYRHGLAGELILGRTAFWSTKIVRGPMDDVPDEAKGAHAHGLQISVPGGGLDLR